jgi:3alpha(or 20beta)-hydroxysteroid dehydrogenase
MAGCVGGKVVIITGGAQGMGAAHARALVAEGARVVVADIRDDEGKQLASELGASARYQHLDVARSDQWGDLVDRVVADLGVIDVLVNNAGIPPSRERIEDTSDESWRRGLDVNLTGAFFGARAVVPVMKAKGAGSIVNISSVQGLQGSSRFHGYVAAKFALRGLTKSLAAELARWNIRVNSVHPGLVETPMSGGLDAPALRIPLRRAAAPHEVSPFVVILASDESAYATGAEFVVDGGLTAVI